MSLFIFSFSVFINVDIASSNGNAMYFVGEENLAVTIPLPCKEYRIAYASVLTMPRDLEIAGADCGPYFPRYVKTFA